MDLYLLLAVALLILGIIGSVAPAVPGVLISVAGVLIYWWSTNFTQPGNLFIGFTVFLGVVAISLDWFSGALTAKYGGASTETSIAAGIAGVLGFIFLGGPIGVVIAVAGTVFLREYFRTGDLDQSKKAGIYSALGLVFSTAMQVVIAVTIFLGFLLALVF
ncbi:MAG: DUF456 domain-containing protein [Candidatus Nanosalina sp.]